MIEVKIRCSVQGSIDRTVESSRETNAPLDIEAITAAFVGCLRQIETAIESGIDVPMLATSLILDTLGIQFKELAGSLDGARSKRRRELARVCEVLSKELATESEK